MLHLLNHVLHDLEFQAAIEAFILQCPDKIFGKKIIADIFFK